MRPTSVQQWCPDCDCLRRCDVAGEFVLECSVCREPLPLSAENAAELRRAAAAAAGGK